MGGAQTKKARKILRQEIKAQFEKEKVTVFPEIRTLVTAAKALKPAFKIFGFTVFKTVDVQKFAGYLTSWGEDGTLKPEVKDRVENAEQSVTP